MIQLQTQVQALQDQVSRMQQSIDMNMGAMRNLIEQSADSVNKMNVAVNELQNKMQGQIADSNGRSTSFPAKSSRCTTPWTS